MNRPARLPVPRQEWRSNGGLSRTRGQFSADLQAGSVSATMLPFFLFCAMFLPHLVSITAELGKN
jgi:hypothetical protein